LHRNWASSGLAGTDVFETLHSGLTVKLVSTPRQVLKTCKGSDLVADVISDANHFDFIPISDDFGDDGRLIGMFHAADIRQKGITDGCVSSFHLPLTEEYLIGADASILDFVIQADSRPCRLVVSGSQIVGLVTLSDLQRLPVRAALFALITGFEMTMAELIKVKVPNETDWMTMLEQNRQDKIKREVSRAQAKDAFVDTLLFTQFADKVEILKQLTPIVLTGSALEQLRDFKKLRNSLAHANEYAASPNQATHVCDVVRQLLNMRQDFERFYAPR